MNALVVFTCIELFLVMKKINGCYNFVQQGIILVTDVPLYSLLSKLIQDWTIHTCKNFQ